MKGLLAAIVGIALIYCVIDAVFVDHSIQPGSPEFKLAAEAYIRENPDSEAAKMYRAEYPDSKIAKTHRELFKRREAK